MASSPEVFEAKLRGIPPVHRFLAEPRIERYQALFGKEHVKRCITETLDNARGARTVACFDAMCAEVLERLRRSEFDLLMPVINGTGIILHTNLGRAPLPGSVFEAMQHAAGGYSNLEYDVQAGVRGSRYARASSLLRTITGAEDALVVNNCAAAVLLILDTFAQRREVIVSRNQLIEIGGGFRLPDVLERSGARLVEVGSTNKVYVGDYQRALTRESALLLRSHPSNYRIVGFTHDVDARELVALANRTGIPLVEDLGSGALADLAEYGLPHERTVQEAVTDGVDLVTFSGDKMLGGPQAGIIAGKSALIARLRANPLLRALRVDKLTIAALAQTLRLHLSPRTRADIPFFAMLAMSLDELHARARRYVDAVPHARVFETHAYVGGGSLPESALSSVAVGIAPSAGVQAAAALLRHEACPIIGRIEEGRLLFDLRTIAPADDDVVVPALQRVSL